MNSMFEGMPLITSLDLSSFNTSNVIDMSSMFKYDSALTSLDLSNFDTSKVENMNSMFSFCSSLVDLDLSNFNTIIVNNTGSMFNETTKLKRILVSSSWNMSNVTFSNYMFDGAKSLVGFLGTIYDKNHIDVEYARIDTSSGPGYLTLKQSKDTIGQILQNLFYSKKLILDIKESEFRHSTIKDHVKIAVDKALVDYDIDLSSLGLHYQLVYSEDNSDQSFYTTYLMYVKDENDEIIYSGIKINYDYSNSNNRNDTDKEYINNNLKNKLDTPNAIYLYRGLNPATKDNELASLLNLDTIKKDVEEILNDKTITYYINPADEYSLNEEIIFGSKGYYVYLFKNDVFYKTIYVLYDYTIKIDIPSYILKNDLSAYETYIKPVLNDFFKGIPNIDNYGFNEIVGIEKYESTDYYLHVDGDDFFYVLFDSENAHPFIVRLIKGDDVVQVESIKPNKTNITLNNGKNEKITVTINPTDAADKTLMWVSSNNKVATVDSNGKITGVSSGSAKITVKTSNGKKATVKVTVPKINAKKAVITKIANQIQTGKNIKPAVEVKLNGKVLKSGTDYTVSYKNNKNAGKATVTVKFKGNYTGSKSTTFQIIPKKVSIKNPTTKKKTITVKYNRVSGAKSYQIAYRIKGTDTWKYTTSKTTSKKISKLVSGSEYEIMVRAKTTIYGEWSDIKSIIVK